MSIQRTFNGIIGVLAKLKRAQGHDIGPARDFADHGPRFNDRWREAAKPYNFMPYHACEAALRVDEPFGRL